MYSVPNNKHGERLIMVEKFSSNLIVRAVPVLIVQGLIVHPIMIVS